MERRMTSIDGLRDEHRRIEAMLTVLDGVTTLVDQGGSAPAYLDDLLDFFSLFADKRHHMKEEERLFPVLAGHGFSPDSGVVNALKHQHELGRTHVGDMRAHLAAFRGGDARAARAFADSARAYTEMLRVHIQMEDHDLFPQAADVLTAEEERTLNDTFAQLDATKAAFEEATRWERLAQQVHAPIAIR
jgi:hemerythrin-like domain-containing protein